MLRFVPALLMFCVATPAAAADWWRVGGGGPEGSRHIVYVDRGSINKDRKGAVRVWTIAVQEKAMNNGSTHARYLSRYDCSRHSWTILTSIFYDDKGAVVYSDYSPTRTIPVAPGTVSEQTMNFSCGRPNGGEVQSNDPVNEGRELFNELAQASEEKDEKKKEGEEEEPSISQGTGFFVGPAGQVLTAYHVIEGTSEVAVYTAGGETFPARVLKVSRATDLALLTIERPVARYLPLAAPGSVRPGDRVFTIGFPVASLLGLEPKFTEGSVSAVSGMMDEGSLLQISVPVQPGNSGGPLVSEDGRVVGIIGSSAALKTFMDQTQTLPQNINYAVKVENALALTGGASASRPLSRREAIELTRDSVVGILAR